MVAKVRLVLVDAPAKIRRAPAGLPATCCNNFSVFYGAATDTNQSSLIGPDYYNYVLLEGTPKLHVNASRLGIKHRSPVTCSEGASQDKRDDRAGAHTCI